MANGKTRVTAKNNNGNSEVDLHHQTTDSPILPPAEYLAQLEQMEPGIIKWFMSETSKEAESRRNLDDKKVEAFKTAQARGQHYGLIFSILSLITTIGLAYLHAYAAAAIIGGTSLVTVAVALIKGRKNT